VQIIPGFPTGPLGAAAWSGKARKGDSPTLLDFGTSGGGEATQFAASPLPAPPTSGSLTPNLEAPCS